MFHTNVSASRKTHFLNCVNFQQFNLVNVTPNSGRLSKRKFASSFESNIFTSCTELNTEAKFDLKIKFLSFTYIETKRNIYLFR